MALHMIVEEMMTGEACVVYSNHDLAQSGVGNYAVQSLNIDGVTEIYLLIYKFL